MERRQKHKGLQNFKERKSARFQRMQKFNN